MNANSAKNLRSPGRVRAELKARSNRLLWLILGIYIFSTFLQVYRGSPIGKYPIHEESLSVRAQYGYNSHEEIGMRSVNVAELKNQLSKYLTFAKGGEEIVIRDRNLPVAKLVPFSAEEASEEELLLVASGKMRLPKSPLNVDELLKIRTGKVSGGQAVQALLDDRDESL